MDSRSEQSPPRVTADLLAQLAQYAGLPLPPDHLEQLVPLLAGTLAELRALRPEGYDALQPASVYRVPPAASPAGGGSGRGNPE